MQDNATDTERRTFLMAAATTVAASALPVEQAMAKTQTQAQAQGAPADAITMAGQLRRGDITPLEALDAAIARVEALPKLNAVVIKNYEQARELARKQSALSSAERKKACETAPLWGLPFVLKDLGVGMWASLIEERALEVGLESDEIDKLVKNIQRS